MRYLLFLLLPIFLIGQTNWELELSKGNIYNHKPVNKFGHSPAGIQDVPTDFWERADATPTQSVWTAPTDSAQSHKVTSSSASDDTSGTGARSIRIYGLTSWDTKEVFEDITLSGTDSLTTVNNYVIIHRMKVLTAGGTTDSSNIGDITATAYHGTTTPVSITAQIESGEGQTLMAIYGIPSLQDAYITKYYGDVMKAQGTAAFIELILKVNPEPQTQQAAFLTKHRSGATSTGTSDVQHKFFPYYKVPGPAIIKIQGIANTDDIDASAGFDLILVDK